MSKKQKKVNANLAEKQSLKQDEISQGVVAESNSKKVDAAKVSAKDDKNVKNKDAKKTKKDKKEKKGGLVKKTKETVSELKKVTWPTFGEVVKKTSVVVAFVIIFGVFLFAVNWLFGGLANLLVGNSFFG